MLKYLAIQNLILIEKANLSFHKGFNILTGETGSGKSAIMHAINLAIGTRADATLIRQGCEKGCVEAIFTEQNCSIDALLKEGGIDLECGEDIIIRREISSSGKGRIFINNQSVPLSFLRTIGMKLLHIVGQHDNQNLNNLHFHQEALDLYANLHSVLNAFQQCYDLEKKLSNELTELTEQESRRFREMEICRQELQEISEAKLKEGEEEDLFAEYTLLSHAEEVATKLREITSAFTGERHPLLPNLNRQKNALETLVKYDSALGEVVHAFQNAFLELQEISHSLQNYQTRLCFNPERLNQINERLKLINHLKRKYGPTITQVVSYLEETRKKLQRFENYQTEKEQLEVQLQKSKIATNKVAEDLTLQRKNHARQLEKVMSQHLQSLNMSKAQFIIEIVKQSRTRAGDDKIEFFLKPNIGERQIALRDGASGGEISRVLLALHTILASKQEKVAFIFDEIDANVGGETATVVGKKLHDISQQQHQVICITHFPQVAQQADHHIQILKNEKEGRTVTHILELDEGSKQQELSRMSGLKATPFIQTVSG